MVNPTIDLVIQFAIMFAIGTAMAIAFVTISHFLSPTSKNPNKGVAYECGVEPTSDARAPFYPWAINLRSLGTVALVDMFVFIAILLVGYFYAWKKGALEWE